MHGQGKSRTYADGLHGFCTERGYPAWRRRNSQGRLARPASLRDFTPEEAEAEKARVAALEAKAKEEAQRWALLRRKTKRMEPKPPKPARTQFVIVSDATIRWEMAVFRGVMNYAIAKRYVPAERKFESRPDLKIMRRDEFTREEYRALHSKARAWVRKADPDRRSSLWYRTVTAMGGEPRRCSAPWISRIRPGSASGSVRFLPT